MKMMSPHTPNDRSMNLPPESDFNQTMHAADERIPVEALDFGAAAIYRVIQRLGNK